MDLRQLATFRMVATTLNFTQAAAALGYAQSSVTAQIQALEADLGTPLFERYGKRIQLTEAGRRLLPYADQLLSLAQEARSALHQTQVMSGSLTISGAETLLTYRLPGVLQVFRQRYPDIQVRLRPAHPRDLKRQIAEGLLDLALILEEPAEPYRLRQCVLQNEPVLLIAAAGHPLTEKEAVCAADLHGESLLLTEPGCSYRNQFEHLLISGGVYPSSIQEFSSIESIKQHVIAGMGIAVLPAVTLQKELQQGEIVALRWIDPPIKVACQLFWRPEADESVLIQAFIEVCQSVLLTAPPLKEPRL